jgi:hypothetical protein
MQYLDKHLSYEVMLGSKYYYLENTPVYFSGGSATIKEKIDKNWCQEDVEHLFEKCSKPKQQQMAESENLWLLAASNGHLGPML